MQNNFALNILNKEIHAKVLEPKREMLIAMLIRTVTGQDTTFQLDYSKFGYSEIYFYYPFDFNYVFISSAENFVLSIADKNDHSILLELNDHYGKIEGNSFDDFYDYLREIEFKFFADCWEEMENRTNLKRRCFFIEHGIMRGLDVNNRVNVDGEKTEEIIANEKNNFKNNIND